MSLLRSHKAFALWLAATVALGCGHNSEPTTTTEPAAKKTVTLTVLGTNDVHGHLEMLPYLAGYVDVVREARKADGGGVVLLDGGDMFQGTLASNLTEGASMVAIFEAMHYTAVAIGNHEFDFGPSGEAATPTAPGDDPQGALKARAASADYPFLAANLLTETTGSPASWKNVKPHTLIEVAGQKVGIIGLTTTSTPRTTIAANFVGLEVAPLAEAITREAAGLRKAGAKIILVTAHAGSKCRDFSNPDDVSSCVSDGEIFKVARKLAAGTVDVIVAGHTHAGVAHRVNGIAIIEAYSNGSAFGRVDLEISASTGEVEKAKIYPPHDVCENRRDAAANPASCKLSVYEGQQVVPDPAVKKLADSALAAAGKVREQLLGVTLEGKVRRSYRAESALGNLFTDLMLAATPQADIAITNGGGLRADLPAGKLTYGALYKAMPFDNRFAMVEVTGAELAAIFADNLHADSGIFSLSGGRIEATCKDGKLAVAAYRIDKHNKARPIAATDKVMIVTSDFLATGGDGAFGRIEAATGRVHVMDGPTIRDAMADVLRKRGGTIDKKSLYDRAHPRLSFPGKRPVKCAH
ncbi:MAG TPA: 5'-nucleotidase C-terminal domain-containing protein [Kofleriaceae bacterium]|nr:5'-nucleotidase C-terminal domain-containing protein [Kofleriaceae bacterium]